MDQQEPDQTIQNKARPWENTRFLVASVACGSSKYWFQCLAQQALPEPAGVRPIVVYEAKKQEEEETTWDGSMARSR
jgi:hypothetical protein